MLKFNFFSRQPPPRTDLLASIPVQNPLVRLTVVSPEETRLTAPLKNSALSRFLGSRAAREKSFLLDELGAYVWNACDGHATVEKIVRQFAQSQRVNLREAEVAVGSFLRTLLKRNLLALATPAPRGGEKTAQTRRRQRGK